MNLNININVNPEQLEFDNNNQREAFQNALGKMVFYGINFFGKRNDRDLNIFCNIWTDSKTHKPKEMIFTLKEKNENLITIGIIPNEDGTNYSFNS